MPPEGLEPPTRWGCYRSTSPPALPTELWWHFSIVLVRWREPALKDIELSKQPPIRRQRASPFHWCSGWNCHLLTDEFLHSPYLYSIKAKSSPCYSGSSVPSWAAQSWVFCYLYRTYSWYRSQGEHWINWWRCWGSNPSLPYFPKSINKTRLRCYGTRTRLSLYERERFSKDICFYLCFSFFENFLVLVGGLEPPTWCL